MRSPVKNFLYYSRPILGDQAKCTISPFGTLEHPLPGRISMVAYDKNDEVTGVFFEFKPRAVEFRRRGRAPLTITGIMVDPIALTGDWNTRNTRMYEAEANNHAQRCEQYARGGDCTCAKGRKSNG